MQPLYNYNVVITPFSFEEAPPLEEKRHVTCQLNGQDYYISLQTDAHAICDPQEKNSWLHIAAFAESSLMLHGFIHQGRQNINLEIRNKKDLTPLMIALKQAREKNVEILLEAGADIHAKSKTCGSALHLAATTNAKIMNLIFRERGKTLKIDLEDEKGETPLFSSIHAKQTAIAEMLIDANATVSKFNKNANHSPLSVAVAAGETKIVKRLLAQGAKIHRCHLHISQQIGEFKISRLFKETPLIFLAIINGVESELIHALFKAGNDPRSTLDDGSNIIYWTVSNPNSDPEILHLFLDEYQINPNQRSLFDYLTPLQKASNLLHFQLLLEHGANPNILNIGGKTPLDIACIGLDSDDPKRIKLLLHYGANPNEQGKCSHPFYRFAYHHQKPFLAPHAFQLTQFFLAKGAKIDERIKRCFDQSKLVKENPEFQQLIESHYSIYGFIWSMMAFN